MPNFAAELAARLKECGVPSPEAETELILAEFSGAKRLRQSADFTPTDVQKNAIDRIVARRQLREPLQYILGHAPFMDLELEVNPSVLIPRPETELLAERVIDLLPAHGALLDLGTGSGAIALAAAQARPDANVLALDLSTAALATARRNAAKNKLNHVEFRESDLCAALREEELFDVVAANLPYVSRAEYDKCEPEITRYEPIFALVAEDGGMELIKRAAREVAPHLKKGGVLLCEMQYDQGGRLAECFRELGYSEVEIFRDYNGFDRFVSGRA